jgi:hypothetical protein
MRDDDEGGCNEQFYDISLVLVHDTIWHGVG